MDEIDGDICPPSLSTHAFALPKPINKTATAKKGKKKTSLGDDLLMQCTEVLSSKRLKSTPAPAEVPVQVWNIWSFSNIFRREDPSGRWKIFWAHLAGRKSQICIFLFYAEPKLIFHALSIRWFHFPLWVDDLLLRVVSVQSLVT